PDASGKAHQPQRVGRNHHVAAENVRDGGKVIEHGDSLERAFEIGRAYIASRGERPVWPSMSLDTLRRALAVPLPEAPVDPCEVVDALARAAEPGLVTTTGPRYFGFVTGGALPATVAVEWLKTVWDTPASLFVVPPATAVVE